VSFFFATSTPTTPVAAGTWINRIVAAQNGAPGGQGIPGQRGSVETSAAIAGNAWSSAAAAVAINSAGYPFAVILDRVTLYNSAAGYAETRFWSGTQWETYTTRINGNLLLDGTLGAQAIVTRSITTDKLVLGAATSLNSFGTTSPAVRQHQAVFIKPLHLQRHQAGQFSLMELCTLEAGNHMQAAALCRLLFLPWLLWSARH
jgi:hypothetical protein